MNDDFADTASQPGTIPDEEVARWLLQFLGNLLTSAPSEITGSRPETDPTSKNGSLELFILGKCSGSLAECREQEGRTAMEARYQQAAVIIWRVATGQTLSWSILTEKLLEVFHGHIIKESVIRDADRELLMIYMNTYRTVLSHCVHRNCSTEMENRGKIRRVPYPASGAPLNDLKKAYASISGFYCWFDPQLPGCKGAFGSCPYKPEGIPDLSAKHIFLLDEIRVLLCNKDVKVISLWGLYTFDQITAKRIAHAGTRTGLSITKARDLRRFVACARVINLATHNCGKCPGLKSLPVGYGGLNDNSTPVDAQSGHDKKLNELYKIARQIIDRVEVE
ncbi:hypothetical protein FFLO_05984 [Filobasidium floriforme]|uniref:Uncharacterized protein n=1 Tax=Filobasidium floriforme TaxID=5210 RepID=A0A8K0NMM8_9TREE|nr:uncharacterized protein HD553DRAFT_322771 [Filobasidium floriforme]KAG7528689.1 hypothetical protein FFLO_05984 [Filobasidium floriforme]KAH8087264.1 hypothetical protein HD553DRAFT_322771 [Filobasidium floriforme]